MKNYGKLFSFELWRFRKIYFLMMGIVFISQLLGTYLVGKDYLNKFETAVKLEGQSLSHFIEHYGKLDLSYVTNSGFFFYPVMITAVTLLIYSIFIWYREWFGKNTFIYRLLMIPTARINIFLSKASAIFLMVLGMTGLQIILLSISRRILQWMIPANLFTDISVMEFLNGVYGFVSISIIIPNHFMSFMIHYGIGIMFIFVLFTAILFERSYRKKGILFGLIYAFLMLMFFFTPTFIEVFYQRSFFYPVEEFVIYCILWAVVISLSIGVSSYLLNKKITV